MLTVHFVALARPGAGAQAMPVTQVQARAGHSLMQAAQDAGVAGIAADCGGLMTCATCHVFVREPWASRLPAPSNEELAMLEFTASARQAGSRLSCQILLSEDLAGLTVDLPASQY